MQDISEATEEVNDGTNAKVGDSARTELPMLRTHLRLARKAIAANPKGLGPRNAKSRRAARWPAGTSALRCQLGKLWWLLSGAPDGGA